MSEKDRQCDDDDKIPCVKKDARLLAEERRKKKQQLLMTLFLKKKEGEEEKYIPPTHNFPLLQKQTSFLGIPIFFNFEEGTHSLFSFLECPAPQNYKKVINCVKFVFCPPCPTNQPANLPIYRQTPS